MNLIRQLVLLLSVASIAGAAPAERPPNIVLILADDLGYGDVGCYGCEDIRTPVIDRLAEQGVRLTQFYSSAPECSPTRTALFTGRYPQRAGGLECAIGTGNVGRYDDAIRLCADHELGLPPADNVLVSALKGKGYATACIGKWHLGYEPQFLPLRHGFDYAFGPLGGGVDYFHHTEWDGRSMLFRNDKPTRSEGYLTDLITREAVDFVRRVQAPFFLYVPYTAPHAPYQVPTDRPSIPLSKQDWNVGTRRVYARMVESLDMGVGAILESLRRAGFDRDTLVIFASDNGPAGPGRAGPFAGQKSTLFEGGIRVPCVFSWPSRIRGGRVSDQVALTMDLTASILRLAGASPPDDRKLDGIDVVEQIASEQPSMERRVFWRYRRADRTWRAVRDGSMKYASRQDGEQLEEFLFDLSADRGEKSNLALADPQEMARLKQLLAMWEEEVKPTR